MTPGFIEISIVDLTMSNITVAIYLGESYAEVEVKSNNSKGINSEPLFHKTFFLPQISFKNILNQSVKKLIDDGYVLKDAFIVTRYFDRLKSFRLGGSVIQVTTPQFENNYLVENTNNLSLAASSLIISLPNFKQSEELQTFLNYELSRLKTINPDLQKVVINLSENQLNFQNEIVDFFKNHQFKVFINEDFNDLSSTRLALISAGCEGTKDEIIEEILSLNSENHPKPNIFFWVKDHFVKSFSNIDLFFSADHFLLHLKKVSKKNILIHTDLERWILIKDQYNETWSSPWGEISYQSPIINNIGLHPFSEIKINEAGHLSFSQTPVATEPGPMIAGRSVKTLILDAFHEEISKDFNFKELFPSLLQNSTQQKIEAQFKVLEKGQIHYDSPLNQEIIKEFIINKLGYDILLHKLKEESLLWTGHLNFLFNKLTSENKPYSWTQQIFKISESHYV